MACGHASVENSALRTFTGHRCMAECTNISKVCIHTVARHMKQLVSAEYMYVSGTMHLHGCLCVQHPSFTHVRPKNYRTERNLQ